MSPFWSVSLFWIVSVLFIAIAMVLILPPLLRKRTGPDKMGRRDINIAVYRDQLKEMEADCANGLLAEDQFHAAKVELETRLTEDAMGADAANTPAASGGHLLGYALGVLLPVAAFGIYFWLGNPTALMAMAEAQSGANASAAPRMPQGHDMAKLAQEMEAKVKADPTDGKSWVMLAKVYGALERWPDAAQAYQQALKLMPKEASVRSAYAEALAIHNNRDLSGEPMKLVREALALDPSDPKALELSGVAAFQDKHYQEAIANFTKLYQQLPPDSPYAKEIRSAIQEAEQNAGGEKMAGLDNLSNPMPADHPNAAAGGASIRGKLDIAPALKGKLSPQETVFVFASAGQGGGPPLAALRIQAGQLPMPFELTDAMAMMPDNNLSKHKAVTLTARVSKSGQPTGGPGDLEGTLNGVKVGANDIKLTIDKVRP
jgi:cytochrome c-type biogenesis protein CcmH